MSRLDILKGSLEKKEAKFNEKLQAHMNDVKRANGQPLNDKRNGHVTLRRWDKQNEVLSRLQDDIQKTKDAIQNEEAKQSGITNCKALMPKEVFELIENGTLNQWGKHPHIMFVEGIEKARIIYDYKKKQVLHKYVNTLTGDERKKFARIYNELNSQINMKP